jgi:hypothetical protein
LAGTPDFSGGNLSGFSGIVDANDERLHGIALSPNPLTRSYAGTAIDWEGARTLVRLSIGSSKDEFEVDRSYDNTLGAMYFYLRRDFSTRWSGEVGLTRLRQEFITAAQINDDTYRRLALRRSFGHALVLSISGERNGRDSDFDPYGENVYGVSVGYALSR